MKNVAMMTMMLCLAAGGSTAGCSAKQNASAVASGYQGPSTVIRGARDLPITRDGQLRAQDGIYAQNNISYGVQPAFVFELSEETPVAVRVTATTGETDFAVMLVGPGVPLMNDDYDGELNPAVIGQLAPGVYRVYVGAWGEAPTRASYALSVSVADNDALEAYEAGGAQYDDYHGEEIVLIDGAPPLNVDALALAGAARRVGSSAASVTVQASATTSIGSYVETAYCAGMVHADAPAVVFELPSRGTVTVRVAAPEDADADTVVIAIDDQGNYHCNDDFETMDAGFTLDASTASRLSVFVGTYFGSVAPVSFRVTASTTR